MLKRREDRQKDKTTVENHNYSEDLTGHKNGHSTRGCLLITPVNKKNQRD